MRFILASLFLTASIAAAQAADVCAPVSAIKAELEAVEARAPDVTISVYYDMAFVNAFTDGLGIGLPPDAAPVGLVIAAGDNAAYVGLIEGGDCIRYSVYVQRRQYERAMEHVQGV